jgi:hypothetical protein
MKQFSHISADFGFTSLVQLTKNIMTIQIGELDPVDFFNRDMFTLLRNMESHDTAAVLFDLDDTPNWDVILDDRKVFGMIHGYLISHDLPLVAEHLLERKSDIIGFGKASLHEQWNRGLCESLTRFAICQGGPAAENEDAVIQLIRRANPGLLARTKHQKAQHFIDTEWPLVYKKARDLLQ